MRPIRLISWVLLCGMLCSFVAVARAQTTAEQKPGHILVAKVRGSVTVTNTDNHTTRPLADKDLIAQHSVVTTAAGSSVILIFSNGATLNLGAESVLAIEEFLQDPFSDNLKLADLQEEPTTSKTTLNLTRGEMVGDVKHLRRDQGSEFTIKTPVGAAGIRGTTFRIVFKPDASGKVFFTLSTADGQVLFTGEAAASVNVPQGQEVTVAVEATVDTTTGAVTVTQQPEITTTTAITAENAAAISTAVTAITTEASQAIIDSTLAAEAKAAAEKAAADEKAAAEKAAAEKEAADKAAAEKEAADKAAADKAAADKAAADKAAADKAAAEKAAADKAAADQAALQQQSNNPSPNTSNSQTTPGDGKTT